MTLVIACEALAEGKRLTLNYDSHSRIVEVHAVGTSTAGNPIMRVWQTSGGSNKGGIPDWRLMRLDRASEISITDEVSEAPRDGYKSGDKAMAFINCEI